VNDSNGQAWIKYAVVLILVVLLGEIPDFTLPGPQDPGWTPLTGLVRAIAAGVAFGLIVFVLAAWEGISKTDDPKRAFRKGLYVSVFVGVGDLLVEFSTWTASRHSHSTGVTVAISRVAEAGKGWFLPILFLSLFIFFIFSRSLRSRRK
jgi:hypothetical protein